MADGEHKTLEKTTPGASLSLSSSLLLFSPGLAEASAQDPGGTAELSSKGFAVLRSVLGSADEPLAPGEEVPPQDPLPPFEPSPQDAILGTTDPPAAPPLTGYVEGESQEILEERTETRKVFQNPDGTRTLRLYPGPVHYRDSMGTLQEIDPRLQRNQDAVRNRAGPVSLEFPLEAAGAVTVRAPQGEAKIRMEGARPAPVTITDNTAVYTGAVDGGDLVLA